MNRRSFLGVFAKAAAVAAVIPTALLAIKASKPRAMLTLTADIDYTANSGWLIDESALQWSASDLEAIMAQGQPPLTLRRIMPIGVN